jgi:MOSC domain-containing protein YiiM
LCPTFFFWYRPKERPDRFEKGTKYVFVGVVCAVIRNGAVPSSSDVAAEKEKYMPVPVVEVFLPSAQKQQSKKTHKNDNRAASAERLTEDRGISGA